MIGQIVLQLDPTAENCRNSEGAFADLGSSRLLFAYSRFNRGSGSDHDHAAIAGRFSDDAGRTWSAADKILVANTGGMNVMSVSLLPLQDGGLGMFYAKKNSLRDCRPELRRSYDHGLTWSDPTVLTATPGYYVLNNDRVIRLRSGRLVVPVALHRTIYRENGDSIDTRALIMFFLSDDDGRTWREAKDWLSPALSGLALQEPGVVELSDGRIMGLMRTNFGQQWATWSRDGGEHWSPAVPTTLMGPCAPATIKTIPGTESLLLAWNDHERTDRAENRSLPALRPQPGSLGRTPLVLAVSRDQGTSWGKRLCIEDSPEHGFCYTAMHFTPDALLLAYCAGGKDTNNVLCRLRLRRIPLTALPE
ncbi:MAG: sialidase family protein [Victivallaceae bacterium]|nr:sialidase family protein [Victivallaceae bacterium]